MVLNFRLIIRITAIVSVIISLAMIPALLVCLLYGEYSTAAAFVYSILPVFVIGTLTALKSRSTFPVIRIRDGLLIVALSWIISSLCGALPFFISGALPNPADAFFESASGFTTTGATVIPDVEILPKGILFWRSFTHWLGGMGILIFAIALLPSLGIGGFRIAEAESSGPTLDKLSPKISDTAKILYSLYIGMTIAETILLTAGGMNLFDALIHTFGSVGTGGFSNYNNSIAHFDSLYIEIIICIFMILASTNFNLYFFVIRGNLKKCLRDGELRAFLLIITGLTVIMTAVLYCFNTCDTVLEGIRLAFFQTVSIITTTVFATDDFNLWPATCMIVLLLLMFVGGCSGSTSGSVKVIRILISIKLIYRGIYKRLHPTAVVPVKLGGRNISSDKVSSVTSFIFLYTTVYLIAALVVSSDKVDLLTAASAAATCLGNVGPGFDQIGPMSDLSLFSDPVTVFLSFLMITGRLELFAVLLLLTPVFWNPDR